MFLFIRDNNGDGVASTSGPFTFNRSLASLHTYLGGKCQPNLNIFIMPIANCEALFLYHSEVDDTRGRVTLLDGGTILNLPMFYLQGNV